MSTLDFFFSYSECVALFDTNMQEPRREPREYIWNVLCQDQCWQTGYYNETSMTHGS